MNLLFENWNKYLAENTGLEGGDKEETFATRPSFKISENWGKKGHDEKKLIESYLSKVQGSSFREKIASIQRFVKDCDKTCVESKDIPEILANLLFLDAISSIIYDFNASTGGFLFESLVAALLGGEDTYQISLADASAKNDVTDVMIGGKRWSIKFLFKGSQTKYVKGSYKNLKAAIEAEGGPITYLVGLKARDHKDEVVLSINFYQFTVGDRELAAQTGDTKWIGNFDVEQVGTYTGKKDYKYGLKDSEFQEFKIEGAEAGKPTFNLGSRADIEVIAQKYADRLGSSLTEIYTEMDKLSKNVNAYFLGAPDSKGKAQEAQLNAIKLKEDVGEYI
jgi:hypothetical protein